MTAIRCSMPFHLATPFAGIILQLPLHGLESITDGDMDILMRTVPVMMFV